MNKNAPIYKAIGEISEALTKEEKDPNIFDPRGKGLILMASYEDTIEELGLPKSAKHFVALAEHLLD